MKPPARALLCLVIASVGCVEPDEAGPPTKDVVHSELAPAPTFALPATWNSDHVRPGTVDLCYLSRGSARLVWGEVTDVVGPVIPADPCDPSAYAYVRPHYEITIREKSGGSMTVIWLDKEARPADVAVGDQLLGGVRQVGAENFVQRFVIVNPTRGQAVVPASLPSLGSTAPAIDPACQLVGRSDVEFAAAMHAQPDVSCDYQEPLDSRGRGGTDDPTPD